MKRTRLLAQMLIKGLLGFALIGALLFGCAGSFSYINAWLFILALAALMLTMGLALLIKEPSTLERRLKTKEKETAQRGYMAVIGMVILASYALAGLGYRFGWAHLPLWISLIALIVMCAGYAMHAAVMLQNAYASRVVEVQEGQKIITGGLYAVVRHPLYLASLLVFLPMPLILGSPIALLPMLLFPVMLILRIKNEEQLLLKALAGYVEYTQKTKYRLIPFVW